MCADTPSINTVSYQKKSKTIQFNLYLEQKLPLSQSKRPNMPLGGSTPYVHFITIRFKHSNIIIYSLLQLQHQSP